MFANVCFVDLMLTVMEASSFTPSVYSVHALTLLAEVKHLCVCDSPHLVFITPSVSDSAGYFYCSS